MHKTYDEWLKTQSVSFQDSVKGLNSSDVPLKISPVSFKDLVIGVIKSLKLTGEIFIWRG